MALRQVPIPIRIDLPDDGARIVLTWPDGRVSTRRAFDLRLRCPCAVCVDEITGRRLVEEHSLDSEVRALSYARIGRYAVQFQWSDGHTTGIYAYERLFPDSASPDREDTSE